MKQYEIWNLQWKYEGILHPTGSIIFSDLTLFGFWEKELKNFQIFKNEVKN